MLMARRCVASRWLLGFAGLSTSALGSVAQEPFNIEGVLFGELLAFILLEVINLNHF